MNTQEDQLPEVIPPSALESITRGEIDMQIATAHQYPRSMKLFKGRAIGMATIDEETAASCIYSRPVGKDRDTGKQKYAEGLSVRMAEIVGASYGNLRVGAMIIEQTPRQVKARGFAHDLETNFAASSEVIESTVTKKGEPYDERMRVVIAKAALAKARRDATFMVVPKALCKPVETECRRVALGDAKTISTRRTAVVTWLGKLGIELGRVWAALGIKGEEDIGVDELATLTGLKTAMKDGEVKVDEAFPPLGDRSESGAPKYRPKTGSEEKPPASAPPRATPLEQVTNLLTASKIEWPTFSRWLSTQGINADSLDEISEPELLGFVGQWPKIVEELSK